MSTEPSQRDDIPLRPGYEHVDKDGFRWFKHAWNKVLVSYAGVQKYMIDTFLGTVYDTYDGYGNKELGEEFRKQLVRTATDLFPTTTPPKVYVMQDTRTYINVNDETKREKIEYELNAINDGVVFVYNGAYPTSLFDGITPEQIGGYRKGKTVLETESEKKELIHDRLHTQPTENRAQYLQRD